MTKYYVLDSNFNIAHITEDARKASRLGKALWKQTEHNKDSVCVAIPTFERDQFMSVGDYAGDIISHPYAQPVNIRRRSDLEWVWVWRKTL